MLRFDGSRRHTEDGNDPAVGGAPEGKFNQASPVGRDTDTGHQPLRRPPTPRDHQETLHACAGNFDQLNDICGVHASCIYKMPVVWLKKYKMTF